MNATHRNVSFSINSEQNNFCRWTLCYSTAMASARFGGNARCVLQDVPLRSKPFDANPFSAKCHLLSHLWHINIYPPKCTCMARLSLLSNNMEKSCAPLHSGLGSMSYALVCVTIPIVRFCTCNTKFVAVIEVAQMPNAVSSVVGTYLFS